MSNASYTGPNLIQTQQTASATDVVTQLQGINRQLSSIGALITTRGAAIGGQVTAASNAIATGGAQVVGANNARNSITFANPGTVTLYVYPMLNSAGGANAPSVTALGGAVQLLPGAILTFNGVYKGAYGAFSATGSTNALTVMES